MTSLAVSGAKRFSSGVPAEGDTCSTAPGSVMKRAQLMDLPDELLVLVFAFLEDVQHVLRLRAVCRRWRDLLLDPGVWGHRVLSDAVNPPAVLDAVLRGPAAAPCLDQVALHSDGYLERYGAAVLGSSCSTASHARWAAVQSVELTLRDEHAGVAAAVVRHQAALGRLREVSVNKLRPAAPLPPGHRALLEAVCEADGLTLLELDPDEDLHPEEDDDHVVEAGACRLPAAARPSSLVTFACCKWLPDAVLEHVLRRHAATLEDVSLECCPPAGLARTPALAALLAEAPRLRQLVCPPLPGMAQLAKCPVLVDVTLVLPARAPLDAPRLRDAEAFLREATTRLRKVSVVVPGVALRGVLADLIAALATPAAGTTTPSRVRTIRFFFSTAAAAAEDFHLVGAVPPAFAAALPGLPSLRRLSVTPFDATPAFLEAITPASAAALRWLCVDVPRGVCAHAWLHSGPVAGVLRRNRGLHLRLDETHFTEPADGCPASCASCRRKCHFRDRGGGGDDGDHHVYVFAHPKEGCRVAHGEGWRWCDLESDLESDLALLGAAGAGDE